MEEKRKRGRPRKKVIRVSIDETHLIDSSIPDTWRCPHCLKNNHTEQYADEILLEDKLYLEHCEHCGYVHSWTLELTEKFKQEVITHLLEWAEEKEPPQITAKSITI